MLNIDNLINLLLCYYTDTKLKVYNIITTGNIMTSFDDFKRKSNLRISNRDYQ